MDSRDARLTFICALHARRAQLQAQAKFTAGPKVPAALPTPDGVAARQRLFGLIVLLALVSGAAASDGVPRLWFAAAIFLAYLVVGALFDHMPHRVVNWLATAALAVVLVTLFVFCIFGLLGSVVAAFTGNAGFALIFGPISGLGLVFCWRPIGAWREKQRAARTAER